ncbi:MAG: hypothetical protein LQ338_006494 [Usnochroma carphineum]|nr:MAG: hypothetical protein LQ338_006494 [Usnochroma carphineum]
MDTVQITPRIIDDMVNFAKFHVPDPIIHISGSHAKTTIALILRDADEPERLPISGFPRQLIYEDEIKVTRQKTAREARRAQSKAYLRSAAPAHATSNPSPSRSPRFSALRRSKDEGVRPSSASEPAEVDRTPSRYPDSADDVGSWVAAQQQEQPAVAELQGSFEPDVGDYGDGGMRKDPREADWQTTRTETDLPILLATEDQGR